VELNTPRVTCAFSSQKPSLRLVATNIRNPPIFLDLLQYVSSTHCKRTSSSPFTYASYSHLHPHPFPIPTLRNRMLTCRRLLRGAGHDPRENVRRVRELHPLVPARKCFAAFADLVCAPMRFLPGTSTGSTGLGAAR
jgi:hypothetical protein